MTDLQKLRNDLAKKYAEGFRYVDWHNTIEIYHAGFDAAVSAMQARVDELKNQVAVLSYKPPSELMRERDTLVAHLEWIEKRLSESKPNTEGYGVTHRSKI